MEDVRLASRSSKAFSINVLPMVIDIVGHLRSLCLMGIFFSMIGITYLVWNVFFSMFKPFLRYTSSLETQYM